ncbi:MAG: lysine--tRNA ligase, partial [Chloroflexi bacterium]|nr:lysine--tRNA ligase [Chloroflexota bacterium]
MLEKKDDQTQSRLDKLERIKTLGINPYPTRFERTHTNREAVALFPEGDAHTAELPPVQLAGRITAARFMGKASFFDIRDGSGRIQVYFKKDTLGEEKYEFLHNLDLGDFIGV